MAEFDFIPHTDPSLMRLEDLACAQAERVRNLRQKSFRVFNGQGFVRLVGASGCDHTIASAARLTAQAKGVPTDVTKNDTGLLRYLMRHRHTTPIEFGEITLHVRVPMDCWRQWIRHRTATVNEFSTRYSPAIDETATTKPEAWRKQSKSNRQGSSGDFVETWPDGYSAGYDNMIGLHGAILQTPDQEPGIIASTKHLWSKDPVTPGDYLSRRERQLQEMTTAVYQERLLFGVANEQARKDLPLSTFTEAWWKIDLHNLFHFLGLRMEKHAQLEIRQCADIIGYEIVAQLFPILWLAFLDFQLNAATFSATELTALRNFMADKAERPLEPASEWLHVAMPAAWNIAGAHRERDDFLAKLKLLQFLPEDFAWIK